MTQRDQSVIFGLNTINVGVLGFAALCSLMGLMLAGKNLFTKVDDMIIIATAIIMVVWYTYKSNKWKKSIVPLVGTGLTFVITLIFLIIEAGTASEFDELISLPALSILLIVSVYYYRVTSTDTIIDGNSIVVS